MVTGLAEARSIGIFDGMLPSMFQLGFGQHVIISGSAVVGSDVGEAETKPVLELDLSADKTDVKKAIAQVVQFAAVSAGMNIDVARHATVQMNGGNPVDLWSNNLRALRCERWWNALPLRSTAVAAVNGANYVPGSPS